MPENELTDAQIEQVDAIHNASHRVMCEVLGKELEWNMEWIGEIADCLADIAERFFGKTEMEIYPYVEHEGDAPKTDVMDMDEFLAIPFDEMFRMGVVNDATEHFNFTGKPIQLRWVAVKGYANDWCIYVGPADKPYPVICREGDKVCVERNIRFLVPCSDEVFQRYRY